MQIWSFLGIALGALSFLVLADGNLRWIGIGCAIGALVLGTLGKKSPVRTKVLLSLVTIALAVCAAISFVILATSRGLRLPHTL